MQADNDLNSGDQALRYKRILELCDQLENEYADLRKEEHQIIEQLHQVISKIKTEHVIKHISTLNDPN